MTKRMTSQTQVGSSHPRSGLLPCLAAFFAASLAVGCSSSSSSPPPKDGATDQAKDTANTTPLDSGKDVGTDTAKQDLAIDAGGCTENGQFYAFGATVVRSGNCTSTCTCLSTGAVGQCTTTCYDGGVPDVPPTDTPITCTRAGKSYNPGESVPLNDGCGGSCVCLTTGVLGACTPACPVDSGLDLPKDTNQPDQPPPVDTQPPIDTACPAGAACNLASGVKGFCAAGVCKACAGATDDASCKTAYGAGNICISGACTAGDCHDSTGCSAGRVCGSSVAHACGDCTTDTQCTADTRYGAGSLCVNNLCVHGDCHDTSADCTGSTKVGQVCGATTAHTCGACTADTQCADDATYSAATPPKSICTTTTGLAKTGQCVANPTTGTGNLCASNNVVCPANSADFCCGNKCVAGNCCGDADCATLGSDFVCRQNTCTRCDSVAGYAYLVDPIGGDDATATGSGMSGGTAAAACSFRTIKQALTVINGLTAPAGTAFTITIVGQTTGSTSLYTVAAGGVTSVDTLPITVPANVTITTKTGPVSVALRATNSLGFQLTGAGAGLKPIAAAPLTINGANGATGAVGILVAPASGSASLGNVTVTNTDGDGIQVTGGTANTILAGVTVTGAGSNGLSISGGTTTMSAGITVTNAGTNGINVSAGTVTMSGGVSVTGATNHGINILGTGVATIGAGVSVTGAHVNGLNIQGGGKATITVTSATAASTVFDSNQNFGISVAGTGVLTISGATVTTGTTVRTVSAKNNTGNNVNFASTSATLSVIDHFYSYNSGADGLRIVADSNLQVRNSVFKANAHNGVNIISSGTDSDLTGIDLGTPADPGNNILQSTAGNGPNLFAGLCVSVTAPSTTQTVNAAANMFANRDCTAANPAAIAASATCAGATNIAVTGGSIITFVADNCDVTLP
jgi:hypothetical protein